MKKILSIIALSIVMVVTARALAPIAIGVAECKLTAMTQGQEFGLVSNRTNHTAAATNVTSVYKARMSSAPFANSNLLALLENSFNTNFPAGSQVAVRFSQILVVDSTGTNVIFSPGGVCNFFLGADLDSGRVTQTLTENRNGETFSGNATQVFTSGATLSYDDSALTTGDGKHTAIEIIGLMTMKQSENLKTLVTRVEMDFQGTGTGQVRDVFTILTGTIKVKAAGGQPPI